MLSADLPLPRPKAAGTQVSVSAHGGEAFLGFCFRRSRWLRRQLKYRCLLTTTQLCQENNAPRLKISHRLFAARCVAVIIDRVVARVR